MDKVTKIHCLNIYDTNKDTLSIYDQNHLPVNQGIKVLEQSPKICGHNIIGYDIPVIRKLYPDWDFQGEEVDTLVISRAAYPDVKSGDYGRFHKGQLPAKLIGKYSLEAWGYRLGELKGEYGKTTDWQCWTPEMTKYCIQDVKVTTKLYERLKKNPLDPRCFELEHEVARIIQQQEQNGFLFDVPKAEKLLVTLADLAVEPIHFHFISLMRLAGNVWAYLLCAVPTHSQFKSLMRPDRLHRRK